MRKGNDDALPRAHERVELVLRLGETARDEGRPLRLEGERLAGRQRVEQGGVFDRHRVESFLLPDGAHLVGQPDEIGPARDGRHQIAWNGYRSVVVRKRRLDEVEATLRGRVDHSGLDRMERTLREG